MTKLKIIFEAHKQKILFLGAFLIIISLIEGFIFNRGFLLQKLLGLEEQHYSITDGTLYKFKLVDGTLFAQSNDPNITFENIDTPIRTVTVQCKNTVLGATGQVFYRDSTGSFSEEHSVWFDPSIPGQRLSLIHGFKFPLTLAVNSLRFDLTDTSTDSLSCSDFIINPLTPLYVDPVRLAVYIGVFLLAGWYIFRNTWPILYRWQKQSLSAIVFLTLLLIFGTRLAPLAESQNIIFIVGFSILLFSFATTFALIYLLSSNQSPAGENVSVLQRYKYEIAIAVLLIITTLPLLTESYFYYDDWWTIGNPQILNKQGFVAFGRPIQALLACLFDKISIHNAFLCKWMFLPAIILYALVLYRWVFSKTQAGFFSLLIASTLSMFAPAMDLLGYTATSAFAYSILFSALSVICFERAYTSYWQRKKSHLLLNSIFAFLLLFAASLAYQLGTQIVFVFLSVEVYFSKRKESLLIKNGTFLIFFAVTNGFYLMFIKFLNWFYLVDITGNRSQMIDSISQVVGKFHFYIKVIVQSLMQVVAAFTGSGFISERYHGYYISFSDPFVGKLLLYFVVVMILVAFISYIHRTRNILGLLSLFVFLPMSFFVFLILSENGYLTYYAFAHISLIMFYFMMGSIASAQFIWRKILIPLKGKLSAAGDFKPATIIAPILVICALVSNYYIRDFYINFNSNIYNFVKYSLQTGLESGEVKRIHIFGSISPINADVYSRFVAETALKDLDTNPKDYLITFSKSKNYLARIEEVDYLNILINLSDNDKQILENFYSLDPTYRQYNINVYPSKEDQIILHRIFVTSGIIPENSSLDTLVIDLTWSDRAYYNY